MKDATTRFIPALGYHWLTWVYDQVVALTTRERRVKTDLLTHANLKPGEAVFDLGCGSGTLALMAVQAVPGLRLTEVDGDPAMLAHARRKVERFGAAISFDHALALGLPYVDATFEVVLSSLFFHLDRAARRTVLREARPQTRRCAVIRRLGPCFESADALGLSWHSRARWLCDHRG